MPDAHAACTVISALVKVPVLSVQMTVVEPSVSTASSFLINALRFAMRRTPIANETDNVAGSPSGTSATMTPSAKTNASVTFDPLVVARNANNTAPRPMAATETRLAMIATWRWSGLFSSWTSEVS